MLLSYTYTIQIGEASPYRPGSGDGSGFGSTGDYGGSGYGDSPGGFDGDNAIKLEDRSSWTPFHAPFARPTPGVKISTCEQFECAVLLTRTWPLEELGC